MRARPPRSEKPLHWVGSSKRDLLGFPERVVDNIGYALGVVQYGAYPPSAKPWKGSGPGVSEIVEDDPAGTYRALYTVRFRRAIYVLPAFQKKSPRRNGTTRCVMARKRRAEVQAGSGNVFADLGYADAKERSLKVQLAMEVNRVLAERGLAQERTARLLGIRQPHVSDLVRYRLNRFSVERLMDFLTVLGKDVQIRVAARPTGRRRAAVQVHHVG